MPSLPPSLATAKSGLSILCRERARLSCPVLLATTDAEFGKILRFLSRRVNSLSMASTNTDSSGSSRSRGLQAQEPKGSTWLSTAWFVLQCLIALPLLPFLFVGWALCAPFGSRRHDHWFLWALDKFGPALIAGLLIGLTVSYLKHH